VQALSFVTLPLALALLTRTFSRRVSYFTSKSHTLHKLNMESIHNRDVPFQWDPTSGIPAIQLHPKTKTKQVTRDQKRDVKMAHIYSLTTREIMKITHLTQRQVLYALDTPPTPKKRSGRPDSISPEQRVMLVRFVCKSRKNRRMSYKQLAKEFDF
jgi:hypothetical protein